MSKISSESSDPRITYKLKGHKKGITCLQFHPNSRQIATGSEDNIVILWNIDRRNDRSLHFTDHTDKITCVDFSCNGDLLASSSYDKTICLRTPTVEGSMICLKGDNAAVTCLEFSPTDNKIISGSIDNLIKIWDIQKKTQILQYAEHTDSINCVKCTYDGKIIASTSKDSTFKIFDVNSGKLIHSFAPTRAKGNHLTMHPNSYLVAVAMSSGSVRVYDIRAMKVKQHYILHDNTTSVGWHPSANFIITCGNDGTTHLVDMVKGKPIYSLKSGNLAKSCVGFSKCGVYFASGGADKLLEIWETNFITLSNKDNMSDNN